MARCRLMIANTTGGRHQTERQGDSKHSKDYLKKQKIIADLLLKRECSFDFGSSQSPLLHLAIEETKGVIGVGIVRAYTTHIQKSRKNQNHTAPAHGRARRCLSKSHCSLEMIRPQARLGGHLSCSPSRVESVAGGGQPLPIKQAAARSLSVSAITVAGARGHPHHASTFTHCTGIDDNSIILTMHNKSKLESRRKAAKMLTAIVILFGICYLPVHLVNFLR